MWTGETQWEGREAIHPDSPGQCNMSDEVSLLSSHTAIIPYDIFA